MTQDELRQLLEQLIEARKARHAESLAEFGAELARLVGPEKKPYSKQHVKLWQSGRANIPANAADALQRMAAIVIDGSGELQARSRPAQITTFQDIPPGTLYDGPVRCCRTPGCGLPYIPVSPLQRYCPVCRQRRKAG
jgi:hypothetical protein